MVDDEFKNEVLRRKQIVQIYGFSVHIISPEDLIILKLLSGREQDNLDAKKIFRFQRSHLDDVYLKKWLEKLSLVLNKD